MTEWHNWRDVRADAIARGQINEADMAELRREYEEQIRTYRDRSPVMLLAAILLAIAGAVLLAMLKPIGIIVLVVAAGFLVAALVGGHGTRL